MLDATANLPPLDFLPPTTNAAAARQLHQRARTARRTRVAVNSNFGEQPPPPVTRSSRSTTADRRRRRHRRRRPPTTVKSPPTTIHKTPPTTTTDRGHDVEPRRARSAAARAGARHRASISCATGGPRCPSGRSSKRARPSSATQAAQRAARQKLRDETHGRRNAASTTRRARSKRTSPTSTRSCTRARSRRRASCRRCRPTSTCCKRQLSELEDQELEVMEQREALDGELAALDATIAGARGDRRRSCATRSRRPRPRSTARSRDETEARDEQAAADRASRCCATTRSAGAQNKGAGAARLVGTRARRAT